MAVIAESKKTPGKYWFDCPGCGSQHGIATKIEHERQPVWSFNGSLDNPTFSPSIKSHAPGGTYCCHFFIRNGVIEFCSDCHHDKRNQKIPLPDLTPDQVHIFEENY